MASPFNVFRKHQRWLLATIGLLAMIAFLVPAAMFSMGGMGGGDGEIQVIARTQKYGDLDEREFGMLYWGRGRLANFFQAVQSAMVDYVIKKQQTEGEEAVDLPTGVALSRYRALWGNRSNEAIAELWLHNKRAEELGLAVDDRAVNDFLREVTEDVISSTELLGIFESIGVRDKQFFAIVRRELLAQSLADTMRASVGGATPAERFDYLTRLRRQASVELVPVEVADMINEVQDPGDQTLEAFFEEHKDAYARPGYPDPGFRQPHRVAIQFLKADIAAMTDADAITDEEIDEAYRENWATFDEQYRRDQMRYDAAVKPDEPSEDESGDETPTPDDPESPSDESPSDESPSDESPSDESPSDEDASDETPTTETPTTEDDDAEEKPTETDAEAEETPAVGDEEEGEADKDDSPEESKPEEGAARPIESPFCTASLLQDGDEEETVDSETPTETTDETTTDEETSEDDAPPAGPPLPEEESPASGLTGTSGVLTPPSLPAGMPEGKRLMIRNTLATDAALEKVDAAFKEIRPQLAAYRKARDHFRAGKNDEEPKPLDLTALAEKHGLELDETGLMNRWTVLAELTSDEDEMREPIAWAGIVSTEVPVVEHLFQTTKAEFLAHEAAAPVRSRMPMYRYLFWKTQDKPAETPKFDDPGVRDAVLTAWKMVEARKLAKAKAETLAEKARTAGGTLDEALGEELQIAIAPTPPFTWLSTNPMNGRVYLSTVPGVDHPNRDFMQTVFNLEEGGVGVATNNPKTTYYVVRAVEFNPSEKVLQGVFEVTNYRTYQGVGAAEQQLAMRAWNRSLKEDVGFEMLQPTDLDRPQDN